MYVSSRFRDIFSSGPIATRRGDARAQADGREPISDAEFNRRAGELHVSLVWLEIAEAHRKAARAFTPESLRAEDLASDDS